MKKIMISIIIICFFLTSCSSDLHPKYVKNIYFSKSDSDYEIIVTSYDFSSDEEIYHTDVINGIDIEKMAISAVNKKGYNFRLCENILVAPDILIEDFNNLFAVVNYLKIPPATNIVCTTEKEFDPDISLSHLISTPVYNFSTSPNGASGLVNIIDNNCSETGIIIIDNGNAVKFIDDNQFKILNMLTGDKSGFSCIVHEGNIFTEIGMNDVYYSFENNILKIRIVLTLKDYKGSINNKDLLKEVIKNNISDIVFSLYNDITVRKFFRLDWHSGLYSDFSNEIEVDVMVI